MFKQHFSWVKLEPINQYIFFFKLFAHHSQASLRCAVTKYRRIKKLGFLNTEKSSAQSTNSRYSTTILFLICATLFKVYIMHAGWTCSFNNCLKKIINWNIYLQIYRSDAWNTLWNLCWLNLHGKIYHE